jgi:hypothetical protein
MPQCTPTQHNNKKNKEITNSHECEEGFSSEFKEVFKVWQPGMQ